MGLNIFYKFLWNWKLHRNQNKKPYKVKSIKFCWSYGDMNLTMLPKILKLQPLSLFIIFIKWVHTLRFCYLHIGQQFIKLSSQSQNFFKGVFFQRVPYIYRNEFLFFFVKNSTFSFQKCYQISLNFELWIPHFELMLWSSVIRFRELLQRQVRELLSEFQRRIKQQFSLTNSKNRTCILLLN